MKKYIVHSWSQKVTNLNRNNFENTWGIGDLLRGTNSLYSVCEESKVCFDIDLTHHPLGKIFNYKSKFVEEDNKVPEFINGENRENLSKKIFERLKEKKNLNIMTNGYPEWDRKTIIKFREFIKPRLELNDFYKKKYDKSLPTPKSYKVIHIRLGDNSFDEKNIQDKEKIFKIIKSYIKPNDYLISDSMVLKILVKEKINVKTLDVLPSHTGTETDTDLLFNNILEFFLCANANEIYTYSVYPWISGFCLSASMIYNVPLRNLRQNDCKYRLKYNLKKIFYKYINV